MWYRIASAQTAVEKVAQALIKQRIRKEFLNRTYRFPSKYELKIIEKRVNHLIKKKYSSIYRMRKDKLERKIKKLVDEVFQDFKNFSV
jgi:hypothetical protein